VESWLIRQSGRVLEGREGGERDRQLIILQRKCRNPDAEKYFLSLGELEPVLLLIWRRETRVNDDGALGKGGKIQLFFMHTCSRRGN